MIPNLIHREAIFWILSNALIVFGLVVTDLAVALAHGRLANSPGSIETLPSYTQILLKFVWFPRELDTDFVTSLGTSVRRLASASQSMYIGCVMFEGALSMDLIFLYVMWCSPASAGLTYNSTDIPSAE